MFSTLRLFLEVKNCLNNPLEKDNKKGISSRGPLFAISAFELILFDVRVAMEVNFEGRIYQKKIERKRREREREREEEIESH